jgi:hypothetical protein
MADSLQRNKKSVRSIVQEELVWTQKFNFENTQDKLQAGNTNDKDLTNTQHIVVTTANVINNE